MNLVDSAQGLRDVTLSVAQRPQLKDAAALEAGDKIAISFAGYADLIGEVVNVLERADGNYDVTTDQAISVIVAPGQILTYPGVASGTVRS